MNFSLIAGAALLAVPIVLHLVMRQRPRQLLFPALQFIKQRREANRRKLQLKQWLLLLLRCLAIVLLALALARPSVPSAVVGNWLLMGVFAVGTILAAGLGLLCLWQARGRLLAGGFLAAALLLGIALAVTAQRTRGDSQGPSIGRQRAPVGAVIAIDTSPGMQYVQENRTRLEHAREMADWLLGQLPEDSEVGIADSRPGPRAFAVDLAAAAAAIERLDTCYTPLSMPEVLDDAIELAATSDRSRREVYVFTDLTRGSWSGVSPDRLQAALERAADVLLYVVDVGIPDPRNTGLGELQLASEVLPKSGELEVQVAASCLGAGGTQAVELYLEQQDSQLPIVRDGRVELPPTELRGKQLVELSEDGSQVVRFRVGALPAGTTHGTVQLAARDPLAIDNRRVFTIEVQEASPVLVLAPPGVVTQYFTEAIAPYEYRETGRARYDCTVRDQSELAGLSLDPYSVVCLIDPGPLTPPDWRRLQSFVEAGGGLGVFLGHNADPPSFNDSAALPVLGGRLIRRWRSPGDLHLRLDDLSHPVTAAFRDVATRVPWSRFPVYRHWVLEQRTPAARTVITYTNNKPAVLDVALGRGRCLVMTTPVSDPLRLRGRPAWNELPTGEDAWPFFVLANEMMRYLVAAQGSRLNFTTGETAVIPNSRFRYPERYQLFTPLEQPQDVVAVDGRIQVKFTEYPGTYRLKGFRGGPVQRGFSVNLPPAATDLQRLDPEQLDALLGAGRYQLARSREDLAVEVGEARLGREFYPVLLSLVALVLGLEYLLANRFYRPAE